MKNNPPPSAEVELLAYINGVLTAAISKAVNDTRLHILAQRDAALGLDDTEYRRLDAAEPERWFALARADFQTALMKLQRAVAQPSTF